MDPALLVSAMKEDRAAGRMPAGIVACYGATSLGAVDPIDEIGRIAQNEGVHLHLDAAWAGSALILPEVRSTLEGLELVDSFVFNPHKWLFTNFDCSVFYMRDPSRLVNVLSLTPVYLESEEGDKAPEYRDWSVALGRRFRALKLWFVLRSYGAQRLREMIRSHIEWTNRLANVIREADDFELTTTPSLALLSFRYAPKWARSEAELDRVNEELVRSINDGGRLYLTKTKSHGRTVIRFVIGQTYTTWKHVEEGWHSIRQTASEILPTDQL
jgi:aromatic-L-amino-acid decarboxylase